jgi:hypothetical protein
VLGRFRSWALASMFFLPMGTLKGTRFESTFLIMGLCLALVPLGVKVLRDGPPPSRTVILWATGFISVEVIVIVLSMLYPELMKH